MSEGDSYGLGLDYFTRTLADRAFDSQRGMSVLKLHLDGRFVPPHTEKDNFVVTWYKRFLEDIARNGLGKDFAIDPSGARHGLTITLWPMNEPYKWNSLRLHAKDGNFGYDAQVRLYLKEHPMPLPPRPVAYMKREYEMPSKHIRDARHYLGLPVAEDEVALIEPVPEPTPSPSELNTGTE